LPKSRILLPKGDFINNKDSEFTPFKVESFLLNVGISSYLI
jgi:hypothetical protein